METMLNIDISVANVKNINCGTDKLVIVTKKSHQKNI
jgi:hypothetical protein